MLCAARAPPRAAQLGKTTRGGDGTRAMGCVGWDRGVGGWVQGGGWV